MISISQIISILYFHSTYITHKLEEKKGGVKKKEEEETELYQLQMSCPPRLDPAVHLPPGIFHTRHIAGAQGLTGNKSSTFPHHQMQLFQRISSSQTNKQKRESRAQHRSVSSLCYPCAP